jgi:hypothetical protein
MVPVDELLELEREGWRALSTDGVAAAAHYERILADDVLVMLPGGLVIDDRERVVDSMSGDPWESFELSGERVLPLDADAAVVAYQATARRADATYIGLFNSTYIRDGDSWRLALHQQTPI